jgi:predicted aspartyl protease
MSVFEEYRFITIEPGHCPRPMLPLRISNPRTGDEITVWGIVDTGADGCAFPGRITDALEIDLQAGVKRLIGTGNGLTEAYAHLVQVDVFGLRPRSSRVDANKIIHSVSATIDFIPNLDCCLIGFENFLKDFILSIDYQRQVFSLSKRDK